MEGASPRDSQFNLEAAVGIVSMGNEGTTVELQVSLEHFNSQILSTEVNASNGRSLVLGTTSALVGDGALILVVTPTIEGA